MEMMMKMRNFFSGLNNIKTYLLFANITLVFFLILLSNLKIIPLGVGDFIFFTVLFLVFALYRPGWAFLFFVGVISLEIINLAPREIGINLRPYQFIGALSSLALIIRFITKKLNFQLAKITFGDYVLGGFVIISFLSSLASEEKAASFKLAVIIFSFYVLYLLVRNFVQDSEDAKKIIPVFLVSSLFISGYGIWQNIRYLEKLKSFEVMFGRPNATFTEPDWLGMFLVLLISLVYALIYYCQIKSQDNTLRIFNFQPASPAGRCALLYFALFIFYVTLILTVARSSWLGAFGVTCFFLFMVLTGLRFRNWQWKNFLILFGKLFFTGLLSILAVYVFDLTAFDLLNRAKSTQSGAQKITISCEQKTDLPEKIQAIEELEQFGCRHINLEEIETEKSKGKFVGEIDRNDPNIHIRSQIYTKSFEAIKENPVLGIGWGSIGKVLGKDPRGVDLNSSNIFLEIWLGAGTFGLAFFLIFFIHILINGVRRFFFAKDAVQRSVGLFIVVSWFAFLIPNMFNAGIMLGFVWVWMAVAQTKN